MDVATYDLVAEPRGDVWRGLVECSLDHCDTFLFVVRRSLPIGEAALRLVERLRPFPVAVSDADEWPGTRLFGGTASVYRYALSSASASVLAAAADGPYSWVQPELPEDLCLLRSDGSPWLVTIGHEQDAYLVLSPAERAAISARLPDLALGPPRDTS